MSGAGATVAILVRKERDLVEHFRRVDALTPDKATTSASMGVEERHAWHILARRGVIRQAPNSGWYLDQAAWDSMRSSRRKLALSLLAVVIGLFVASLMRTWLQ